MIPGRLTIRKMVHFNLLLTPTRPHSELILSINDNYLKDITTNSPVSNEAAATERVRQSVRFDARMPQKYMRSRSVIFYEVPLERMVSKTPRFSVLFAYVHQNTDSNRACMPRIFSRHDHLRLLLTSPNGSA